MPGQHTSALTSLYTTKDIFTAVDHQFNTKKQLTQMAISKM